MAEIAEHILELQTIARFAHFSMHGVTKTPPKHELGYNLKLGPQPNPAQANQLSTCTFWKHSFKQGFAAWNRRYSETPEQRLYTLLGSLKNADDMVNCDAKLNSMKARVRIICTTLSILTMMTFSAVVTVINTHAIIAFSCFTRKELLADLYPRLCTGLVSEQPRCQKQVEEEICSPY